VKVSLPAMPMDPVIGLAKARGAVAVSIAPIKRICVNLVMELL
jgi:hypothetical protein